MNGFWYLSGTISRFTAVTVPCLLVLGLIMADLINRHVYGGSAVRIMIFIPYIASVVCRLYRMAGDAPAKLWTSQ